MPGFERPRDGQDEQLGPGELSSGKGRRAEPAVITLFSMGKAEEEGGSCFLHGDFSLGKQKCCCGSVCSKRSPCWQASSKERSVPLGS